MFEYNFTVVIGEHSHWIVYDKGNLLINLFYSIMEKCVIVCIDGYTCRSCATILDTIVPKGTYSARISLPLDAGCDEDIDEDSITIYMEKTS